MTTLEKLRAKTLGKSKSFKKELIEIEGEKFELRQPTVRQRGEIRKRCTSIDGKNFDFDMFEFMIQCVIACTYVPDTDEKVFSDEDYQALQELPAGGWLDDLSEKAIELCNVKGDVEKKNSEKTESED